MAVTSFLRDVHPLPPGRFLVLISVRSWVGRRTTVLLEDLRQFKNPVTLSGVELAAFRLVSKYLNQLRYRMSFSNMCKFVLLISNLKMYAAAKTANFHHQVKKDEIGRGM
jgi:hypothetical protein